MRGAVVVLAVALAAFGTVAERAAACGNTIAFAQDDLVRAIREGNFALERGDYADAIRVLHAVRARHSSGKGKGNGDAAVDRAHLVWIRAVVRGGLTLDGKMRVVSPATGAVVKDDEDDNEGADDFGVGDRSFKGPRDLAEAMRMLDRLAQRRVIADEALEVRAEAMARVSQTRSKGVRELQKLAAKDLLTSPESWAVLADALEARGDIEPALHAHDRCARMAANRVVQCARTPAHVATR